MRNLKTLLVLSLLSASPATFAQVVNWTVSIQKLYIGNDSVKVVIQEESSPNPSGSTWNCTSNLVSLGGYADPVPASLKYSAAMEAYKSKTTARIGVEGSGSACILTYITLNENITTS